MKAVLPLVALVVACSLAPPSAAPALAEGCPSSSCAAVPRGQPSYPCHPGQIKGEQNSKKYYLPWHGLYAATGSGQGSNTSCFDSEAQAESSGFRPA